jgi:NAD(P)-dependent dehydrogenase (short-subunit alcohol dehydrogenase family)
MSSQNKRKVVFVTGASSGIGRASAEASVKSGYATVLVDRDEGGGRVCPGMIDTPMWHRSITPELTAALLEGSPAGRFGSPHEIAAAVLWLCGDSASFVTGQAIAVDGGYTSR